MEKAKGTMREYDLNTRYMKLIETSRIQLQHYNSYVEQISNETIVVTG